MNGIKLEDNLMLRTAFRDRYRELVEKRRMFERFYDLFALALVVGVIRDQRSSAKPESDIILLGQVRDETRLTIEIVNAMLFQISDQKNRWNHVLSYADGGLESLWQEIQAVGQLDLLRLLGEAKEKWGTRLSQLLPQLSLYESR